MKLPETMPPAPPEKPLRKINPKTIIIFIATWFVAIIAIFAGAAIYTNYQGKQYAETAVPYLQKVIPEISQWDPKQIEGLMTPEAFAKIPEKNFLTLITWFSKLGKLEKIEDPKFEKTDARTLGTSEQQRIVEYTVALQFENGEAILNIKLLERDGTFSIYHFALSSEALAVK